MARRASHQPTDAELEILRALWDAGPLPLGRICTAVRAHRPVATTTVATTLGVMLGKGYVKRRQEQGRWLWSAAVKREATATRALHKMVDHLFDGSASQMVVHLIDEGKLSPRDIETIRQMLDEYQRREGETPE